MWKGEATLLRYPHVARIVPMNTLDESSDNRSPVLYHRLLSAMTTAIKRFGGASSPTPLLRFFPDGDWIVDVDALAVFLARRFASLPQEEQQLFELRQKSSTISIHFADLLVREEFSTDLRQLKDVFQKRISEDLRDQLDPKPSVDQAISQAMMQFRPSLQSYLKQAPRSPADLRYADLGKSYSVKRQRLHLRKTQSDVLPCLKGHRLEIRIERLKDISEQIAQGIRSSVSLLRQQGKCDEQEEIAVSKELERQLNSSASTELSKLSSALVDQSLPRLQRAASLYYLDFLIKGLQEWAAPKKKEALPLLRILRKRLALLEQYLSNPNRDELFLTCVYQDQTIKLRGLLCRANAFDPLPILGLIGGKVGETYEIEQAYKTFIFGVKLKLNGSVYAHGGDGAPVFEYRTDMFRPNSALYQKREKEVVGDVFEKQAFLEKVLCTALLYLFVFTEADNEAFDPSQKADEFFEMFHGTDEAAKRAYLQRLSDEIRTAGTSHVRQLRTMLVAFLHNPRIGVPSSEETLLLSLQGDILNTKDEEALFTYHRFFKDDWADNGGKDILKYVSVDEASAGNDALCRLPVTFRFETLYYDPAEPTAETLRMFYGTDALGIVPVAFVPYSAPELQDGKMTPGTIDERVGAFLSQKHIQLVYRQHEDDFGSQAVTTFVYRLSYLLLSYLFLKIVLDTRIPVANRRRVFVPIACLHIKEEPVDTTKVDTETFLHRFAKVLAHMLAEDYQANSQGFHLPSTIQPRSSNDKYKLPNALASLYNTLPRRFVPLQAQSVASAPLDKLAILTVSSRKTDVNAKSPNARGMVLYGDMVGMERQSDGSILVQTLTTFSACSLERAMFEHPDELIAQITAYYRQGYKHFLYVARAPYSNSLRLPNATEPTKLYFMNEEVLQAMRQIDKEIKIYPIFFDAYSVVQQQPSEPEDPRPDADSLYINDLRELANLADDKNKHTVTFLNVFNGQKVGRAGTDEARIYRRVITYGTLVNMYQDTSYYQYIWQDLLGQRLPGSLSSCLLEWLTLLHFLRYERSQPDRFKLDPYGRIIGDDSVGACSLIPHMAGRIQFNMLAFLSHVRAVLQAQQE